MEHQTEQQPMGTEAFMDLLKKHSTAFVQLNGEANITDGWEISVQGKTLEDSRVIFNSLYGLLESTKCSFKFATQMLIDTKSEQSTKLLTIYIPNGVEVQSFAELVRLNLNGYTGADDITEKRSYTKYAPGIFYRNDRTSTGEYIPA